VGALGRRGRCGEDAHARRTAGERARGMRLGLARRGALGRPARRRRLRWALGLRGAGLPRLGRTPLGCARWAGHVAQERGEGRRGAGGATWAAGARAGGLVRMGFSPFFSISCSCFLFSILCYFILNSNSNTNLRTT
jgi:hypothetical protein